jgi:hypothetical protein
VITARIEGAQEVARSLSGVPASLAAETRLAMTTSLTLIEADARRNVKMDTRALMGSITSKISGAGIALTGEVGPSLRYGYFVEYGRRPGRMPPIAAIEPWARRHGMNPFLVARAIGRKGIRPAPFMAPALAKNLGAIRALFEAIGVKVASRIR